jgi:hypothetical protein
MTLGKLEMMNIREQWKKEDEDFTPWLSREENLNMLGDEINLKLKLVKTEASVGKYSADIVAQTDNEEKTEYVIIENQLEDANHDHLGKLITYGSGFDAKTLIWIFKDIDEEHRKAIDWLNENSELNVFAIKIELWKIDNSNPAPKFQIICSPNNWSELIKKAYEPKSFTDTNLQQLEFWTNFNTYLENSDTRLKIKKPQAQHWYDFSSGNAKVLIQCILSFKDNNIRCDIYISDDKDLFKKLLDKKIDIEKDLGFELEWQLLPDKKGSRLKYQNNSIDLSDKTKDEEYFSWLKNTADKYLEVLPKYW